MGGGGGTVVGSTRTDSVDVAGRGKEDMAVQHQRADVKVRATGSGRGIGGGGDGGVHGLDLSEDELLRRAGAVPRDGRLAEPA